jgi:hypothetical protein
LVKFFYSFGAGLVQVWHKIGVICPKHQHKENLIRRPKTAKDSQKWPKIPDGWLGWIAVVFRALGGDRSHAIQTESLGFFVKSVPMRMLIDMLR